MSPFTFRHIAAQGLRGRLCLSRGALGLGRGAGAEELQRRGPTGRRRDRDLFGTERGPLGCPKNPGKHGE
jgi:hypothetical protein